MNGYLYKTAHAVAVAGHMDRDRTPNGYETKETKMNRAIQITHEKFFKATVLCSKSLMKISEPAITTSEQLMPYGAAAKAIFIKANGLTAYNKAFSCENLYCSEEYEQAPT